MNKYKIGDKVQSGNYIVVIDSASADGKEMIVTTTREGQFASMSRMNVEILENYIKELKRASVERASQYAPD